MNERVLKFANSRQVSVPPHVVEEINKFPICRDGEDLKIVGEPFDYLGLELRRGGSRGMSLFKDGLSVMNAGVGEHLIMARAVGECPDNARVFIGGLGFGLVLLYLSYTGKAKEVIVSEIDDRVISQLGSRITNYLKMPIKIVHQNAYTAIKELGKFDWIYMDIDGGAPASFKPLAMNALTERGVYTPYEVINWEEEKKR